MEGHAVFDLRQPIALSVCGIRGDECVAPQESDDGLYDSMYRFSGLRWDWKSTIEFAREGIKVHCELSVSSFVFGHDAAQG